MHQERNPMTYAIVLSSSMLVVVLVVALVRGNWRRWALQLLSSQILKRWTDRMRKTWMSRAPWAALM